MIDRVRPTSRRKRAPFPPEIGAVFFASWLRHCPRPDFKENLLLHVGVLVLHMPIPFRQRFSFVQVALHHQSESVLDHVASFAQVLPLAVDAWKIKHRHDIPAIVLAVVGGMVSSHSSTLLPAELVLLYSKASRELLPVE